MRPPPTLTSKLNLLIVESVVDIFLPAPNKHKPLSKNLAFAATLCYKHDENIAKKLPALNPP